MKRLLVMGLVAVATFAICTGLGGCKTEPKGPIDYPLYDPVHSNYPFADDQVKPDDSWKHALEEYSFIQFPASTLGSDGVFRCPKCGTAVVRLRKRGSP